MTKSDAVGALTRGLAGPWKVAKPSSGVLKFSCQSCSYETTIHTGTRAHPRIVSEEFNKLAHDCSKSLLSPERDAGFVTIRRKRYGVEQ